jgi:hypothetical protein
MVRGMRALGHSWSIGMAFHAEAMACFMAWGGALSVRKNIL